MKREDFWNNVRLLLPLLCRGDMSDTDLGSFGVHFVGMILGVVLVSAWSWYLVLLKKEILNLTLKKNPNILMLPWDSNRQRNNKPFQG